MGMSGQDYKLLTPILMKWIHLLPYFTSARIFSICDKLLTVLFPI